MPTYILNFVKAGTPHKQQLGAQARKLLDVGLWGIPPTSPARTKLTPGDRLIAYVGSPERVFIGDALVDQAYHSWTPDEAARYPETATYEAGISLREVAVWAKPLRQQDVWPKLAAAQKNPGAMFMQATLALLDADGAQLVEAGRGEVSTTPTPALPTKPPPPPCLYPSRRLCRLIRTPPSSLPWCRRSKSLILGTASMKKPRALSSSTSTLTHWAMAR